MSGQSEIDADAAERRRKAIVRALRRRWYWKCNECGDTFEMSSAAVPKRCKTCLKSGFMRPDTDEEKRAAQKRNQLRSQLQ